MKKYAGAGAALKARHYIFVGDGEAVFFFFFFFQSSGRLVFVKMYNFMQVVVLLKNAVLWVSFVQMGSFGMKKKKFLFLEEGSPEKNELRHNVSALVMGLTCKLTL